MPSFRRLRFSAVALVGLAVAAAGCGSSDPLDFTLQVTSSSGEASVTYDTGDGPVTEIVTTPWELPAQVNGEFAVSLSVENLDDSGTVFCAIRSSREQWSSIRGEVRARCRVSGSARGGQLDILGFSSNVNRETEEGPPNNGVTEQAGNDGGTEEASEISIELRSVAVDSGEVSDPVAFVPFAFELVVRGANEPGQMDLNYQLDTPDRSHDGDSAFRFALDDLDEDGNLVIRIPTDGGFVPVAGEHRIEVAAQLGLDSGGRRSFDDVVEYVVEQREMSTEVGMFVDGVVGADVPQHWTVRLDHPLPVVDESEPLPANRALGPEDIEEVLWLERSFSEAVVSVLAFKGPLAFGSDDELVGDVLALIGEGWEAVEQFDAAVGGVPTTRFSGVSKLGTPDAERIEVDLLSIGDARFLVQAYAGGEDVGEPWREAGALRDSLTFDASAVPRLLHRINFVLTKELDELGADGLGTVAVGVVTPANWIPIESERRAFGDPDVDRWGRILVAPLGDRSLDDVIAEGGALDAFERREPPSGFDDLAIATMLFDGRAAELLVLATLGEAVMSLYLFDGTSEPDLDLLAAIAETLHVRDP